MVTELHRIGYELIFGCLSGGIMAWMMSVRAVEQPEQASPQQFAALLDNGGIRVIDVRTPAKWNNGRIQQAEHRPLRIVLKAGSPSRKKT